MKVIFSRIRRFLKEADMFLFSLCMISSLFGLLLIYSATLSYAQTSRYIIVQLIGMLLGIFLFVLFSLVDLYDLSDYWKFLLGFNVLLIASTAVFGIEVSGNRSWLEIPLIRLRLQPAEVAKIPFILLSAKQMYLLREKISALRSVFLMGSHLLLTLMLIWFSSGDMGMALVYVFIFVCMMFAAGVKLRWFLLGAGGTAALFPLLWTSLGEYQKRRILVVLDPSLDPLGIGYQASRSKLAIGAGKLTGQGLFNGTLTQSGTLPAKHTDFIFSVAGEELGMLGNLAIVLLLLLIIFRCLYIATKARNGIGALVCTGVAAMLIFQVFENIGMCIGITPVIGITLPFFSYGGSSILTMFAAMGLVSGVRMRPMPSWLKSSSL